MVWYIPWMLFVNCGLLQIIPLNRGNQDGLQNATNVVRLQVNKSVKPAPSSRGLLKLASEFKVNCRRVHPFLADDHSNGNAIPADRFSRPSIDDPVVHAD